MEGSRSTSRSRRSYPNLHNLSLAPLSAKYPLDASAPPSPDETDRTPSTSYIAQKSAPTTPGILSLSQSRSNSRPRAKKTYAYDGYFIDTSVRDLTSVPKAKSTSTLLSHPHGVSFAEELAVQPLQTEPGKLPEGRHHTRKRTAPLPTLSPLTPLTTTRTQTHTLESNEEWLHRAGLAITSESRNSKGQGWLSRRESSTSLIGETDDFDPQRMALLSGEHLPDPSYPSFFSPRMSRAGSRITSRVPSRAPSARQSRRGSRVGSRIDLLMSTAATPHHPLDLPQDADFQPKPHHHEDDRFQTPDFFEDEDEEVARLARTPGFGWVDRLIGWSLFSVVEDGAEAGSSSEEEKEEGGEVLRLPNISGEELRVKREVEAKRRKAEREGVLAAAAVRRDEGSRPSTADEDVGGWQDAAWLLSVASKALLS